MSGKKRESKKIIFAPTAKKLKGRDEQFRLRVGDWRIIFRQNEATIEIIAILPRGQAYK
ncbi:MAG TPA: type II toxin-antitoxin system RelE/ParE family toxin [Syntrophomonadaceae bacterium]|nr:type II toxin-antitoxin system RelE/ParE family toxin [Syntrophomonadaceae bacterium]